MKADFERLKEKAQIALEKWKTTYPDDLEQIAVLESIIFDLDDKIKEYEQCRF